MTYAIETTDYLRNAALSHPTPYHDSTLKHSRNKVLIPLGVVASCVKQSISAIAQSGECLMQIIPSTATQLSEARVNPTGNMEHLIINIHVAEPGFKRFANRARGHQLRSQPQAITHDGARKT